MTAIVENVEENMTKMESCGLAMMESVKDGITSFYIRQAYRLNARSSVLATFTVLRTQFPFIPKAWKRSVNVSANTWKLAAGDVIHKHVSLVPRSDVPSHGCECSL